jgi:hypothetical protein
MSLKREQCEWFEEETGNCIFYKGVKCFHSESNPLLRCYKLQPRTEGEYMPWMGELCSDCNESECNDCHMYQNYYAPKKLRVDV